MSIENILRTNIVNNLNSSLHFCEEDFEMENSWAPETEQTMEGLRAIFGNDDTCYGQNLFSKNRK